jgi:hypothetical protein
VGVGPPSTNVVSSEGTFIAAVISGGFSMLTDTGAFIILVIFYRIKWLLLLLWLRLHEKRMTFVPKKLSMLGPSFIRPNQLVCLKPVDEAAVNCNTN